MINLLKINDYECYFVRVHLNPGQLSLLYINLVHNPLSFVGGVVFKDNCVLVDFEVYSRFVEYCEELNILKNDVGVPLRKLHKW